MIRTVAKKGELCAKSVPDQVAQLTLRSPLCCSHGRDPLILPKSFNHW
jgi:hypothetical protein